MPPGAVKTVRDAIFWQYAKLIAKSAGMGIESKESRAFQMSTFKKLQSGEMHWSTTIREYLRERENPNECVYCGAEGKLTVEHLLPKSCGGEDTTDNVVMVCAECNSKKGKKKLYEYFTEKNRDKVPRIAEGKYLKMMYELNEKLGTLDIGKKELTEKLCPKCSLKQNCIDEGHENKLTVYCIEGLFR